jgi:hypothetical protein
MQFKPKIDYPDDEKPKLVLLENLFQEWLQHFANAGTALKKHVADDMVSDGFYPHYFSQKKRILFIGKEARGISGDNYIDVLYPVYRGESRPWPLNSSKFHSRMIRIAYGLIHGMQSWQEIPRASEIGHTFGEANGLSFAFMNISKLSNDGDNWQADMGVINVAHNLSTQGRKFNLEEVRILQPHIVITMNLGDKIAALGQLTPIHASNLPRSFWLDSAGHRSLLIDTWHFAAPRKKALPDYYIPICDAIRRSGATAITEPKEESQI